MRVNETSESKDTRQIAVIYENAAIREHAVQFCARLEEEFGFDFGSEQNWWPFSLLTQQAAGSDAARRAANADIMIFATSSEGDLPREIKLWIENWLDKRGEREGALVSVTHHAKSNYSEIPPFKEIYLRHIAHRAGMDFLSRTPPTASKAMPDSIDSFNDRAGCMTATLDEILHKHPHTAAMPLV